MHNAETETYIKLRFLLPITWRISRLFHLSVTYVGITLLFQQPGRGISLSHTHELCPLNRRHSEPSGKIGDGAGRISHSQASSISQFIRFTKGVLFHWWEQSIDRCYPDESNSIKRDLHLGPQKRGLIRGQQQWEWYSHPSSAERRGNEHCWKSAVFPVSCLVLIKLQPWLA